MTGHLDLVCGLDTKGRSQLLRQSFRAPMHISKPHLDGDTLIVNVVNPTAGLFEGDEISCDVRVESGARLLLTSPAATRAHRMTRGGEATLTQRFAVEADGWLEIWPELFIPQGGARYRQKTTVDLAQDSCLLLVETLAPGRVASGEAFTFEYLDWETDIFCGGEHTVREKYAVTPTGLEPLRRQFPTAYYACLFFFHPKIDAGDECWQAIRALHSESTWIGLSRLHRAGWNIKILAADSVRFRKAVQTARQLCYEAIRSPMPDLRKY